MDSINVIELLFGLIISIAAMTYSAYLYGAPKDNSFIDSQKLGIVLFFVFLFTSVIFLSTLMLNEGDKKYYLLNKCYDNNITLDPLYDHYIKDIKVKRFTRQLDADN